VVDIVSAADIISIGISSAAFTMSITNSIQLLKLDQEVETITKSLTALSSSTTTHTTQFFHVQAGQLKPALSINHTQMALNRTIDLVNRHDMNIENLAIFANCDDF
jgi:hypothetical protein